ncbi:DUF3035 domain-containing protein [Holospora curviuscula]|uniref:DUF3035 domain-containing protein n=1 Tax=Holospora curviuscula TaxID=1082868 RepID=UPI0013FDCABB|nr:DUF3035 domain-containing protein [Holospora curviuscula]
MTYKNFYGKASALLSVLILTQCQSVQKATGIKKVAPDAWSVQPLRELEIPPGFQDMPSDHPISKKILPSTPQNPGEKKEKNCSSNDAEQSLLEHVQPFLKK